MKEHDIFNSRNAILKLREKGEDYCNSLRNRCKQWEHGCGIAHKLASSWISEYFAGKDESAYVMATAFIQAKQAMEAAVFTIADS